MQSRAATDVLIIGALLAGLGGMLVFSAALHQAADEGRPEPNGPQLPTENLPDPARPEAALLLGIAIISIGGLLFCYGWLRGKRGEDAS